jgi:hypothetical protein
MVLNRVSMEKNVVGQPFQQESKDTKIIISAHLIFLKFDFKIGRSTFPIPLRVGL